jgi:hypothetical protein
MLSVASKIHNCIAQGALELGLINTHWAAIAVSWPVTHCAHTGSARLLPALALAAWRGGFQAGVAAGRGNEIRIGNTMPIPVRLPPMA